MIFDLGKTIAQKNSTISPMIPINVSLPFIIYISQSFANYSTAVLIPESKMLKSTK